MELCRWNSCLMNDFSWSTVWCLHYCIIDFIMHHTLSMGDMSGKQSSTRTLLPQSHADETRTEHCMPLSCWNKKGCTWKTHCLDSLLQNLYLPFSIDVAFKDVQVTHAIGTNAPPCRYRCWLLNFTLMTLLTVHFLFSREDTMSMISKNNLKRWLVTPQYTFPLCSPSRMSSGPEEVGNFSGCYWYLAFNLRGRLSFNLHL